MHTVGSASRTDYDAVYRRHWREASRAVQASCAEWTETTAADLIKAFQEKTIKPGQYEINTLRKYRAALIYCLPREKPLGWADAVRTLDSMDLRSIQENNASGNAGSGIELFRTGKRRQSQRMIPEEDFRPLIDYLESKPDEDSGSIWRGRAALALKAGVAAGCRPLEWLGVQWTDRESGVLRIHSIKQKTRQAWDKIPALTFLDGDDELASLEDAARFMEIDAIVRHNDFARKLIFLRALEIDSHLIDEIVGLRVGSGNISAFRDVVIEQNFHDDVDKHLAEVQSFMREEVKIFMRKNPEAELQVEELFSSTYLSAVRGAIWRACRRIFLSERLYSLADARSTFAANRKALAGLKATAMDMGHAWPQTTRDFYAPARRAWARHGHAGPRMQELAKDYQRHIGIPSLASSRPQANVVGAGS